MNLWSDAKWQLLTDACGGAVACFAASVLLMAFCLSGCASSPPGLSAERGRDTRLAGAADEVTAFVDVSVVPMDTDRVLSHQTVVVSGGRISAMGPVGRVTVPGNAVRIDGAGKYLTPGLADMHVHLNGINPFGNVLIQYDTADAERRLLRWVARGITTVRNMDWGGAKTINFGAMGATLKLDPSIGLYLRSQVAAGQLIGPRIYTSGEWGPYTHSFRHDGPLDSVAIHAAAVGTARALVRYKAAGYDFIKVHEERGEVLDSISAVSHRIGIPFVGHMEEPNGLARAIQLGYRSVEHLSAYAEIGESEAAVKDAAAVTRRAGLWNCPTADLNTNPALVNALQEAGAPLLLGSDTPFSPGAFTELQALVKDGLTPYQALVAGTRNVALFFGTLAETGTISVGKRADLVLVAGNPLEDVNHMAQPLGVVLAGRWFSRAELARLLAVPTPAVRARLYWAFAWSAPAAYVSPMFHLPVTDPDVEQPGSPINLAPVPPRLVPWLSFVEQYTGIANSASAVHRQLAGVVDSLVRASTSTDSTTWVGELRTGRQRVLEFVARQLGVARAGLPADRRDAFDQQARATMQQWAEQGYQVVIPEIQP
jgi:imidazolonepropionase-like amidohydrolase